MIDIIIKVRYIKGVGNKADTQRKEEHNGKAQPEKRHQNQ